MQPLYDGTLENRKHWQDLAEKVEMGLTWIDHDVIEKPVEEFPGKYTVYFIKINWHFLIYYICELISIIKNCTLII